jgi:hypothetical protein
VILAINNQPIDSMESFVDLVSLLKPKQKSPFSLSTIGAATQAQSRWWCDRGESKVESYLLIGPLKGKSIKSLIQLISRYGKISKGPEDNLTLTNRETLLPMD